MIDVQPVAACHSASYAIGKVEASAYEQITLFHSSTKGKVNRHLDVLHINCYPAFFSHFPGISLGDKTKRRYKATPILASTLERYLKANTDVASRMSYRISACLSVEKADAQSSTYKRSQPISQRIVLGHSFCQEEQANQRQNCEAPSHLPTGSKPSIRAFNSNGIIRS